MAATKEFGGLSTVDSTIIGPSILISGKLSGDEDLTVRGRVEGELSLSRTLIVEPTGIVKANVSVRNAVISGVVVGNISAIESVELTRDGRMVGDIRSPRVIIVDGASFRGHVDMGNAEPRKEGERPAARPVVRPVVRAAAPAVAAPARPVAPPAPARAQLPVRPPLVAKPQPPVVRPQPPPALAALKVESRSVVEAVKPPPPPPPQPLAVAEAGKRKVLLKKKTK
jgi:cytoskeletal protein CcmA (bactofilin family)